MIKQLPSRTVFRGERDILFAFKTKFTLEEERMVNDSHDIPLILNDAFFAIFYNKSFINKF